MQIFCLHKSIYKLNRFIALEETLPPEALTIKETVHRWQILKEHKIPENEIEKITGISRSTFYRWQKAISTYGIYGFVRKSRKPKNFRKSKISRDAINKILLIRRENPTYGKAKITVILKRDYGILLSESSVGRELQKLISKGQIIKSISFRRARRKRKFTSHAKKWLYGMKSTEPGDLV